MPPPHPSRSSGDVLADRRFLYAEALTAEGDHAAAADLLEQTVEQAPGWVAAWVALGLAHERLGAHVAARSAFAQAARLDEDGAHGAALHLARLMGEVPATMPGGYVRALFDDYAERFDAHLVGGLGYRGPALLAEALDAAVGPRRFGRCLDLGCGTGLMAPVLRARVDHLSGIDLSPAMVAQAERRGLYDQLAVGALEGALADSAPAAADLIVAADVFAYLGPLEGVVGLAARVLSLGGVLAFTVQHGMDEPVRLGPDMRFSHSTEHVAGALAAAGLRVRLMREASTRRDAGAAVPGLVVVAESA